MDNPQQERPWGWWQILTEGYDFTVKLLMVLPGQMLSLQSHQLRSERWQVVEGEAIVYCEGTETVMMQPGTVLLSTGHTYHIPRNVKHRLINPTAAPVLILETIKGQYSEDDIIRYHDSYGRQ